MKNLLELIANTRIKIKFLKNLIMYQYMICCKLKLIYMEIINYKCIEHTHY